MKLNSLIAPYMPKDSSVQLTDNFLDILRTCQPDGLLASLDVDSLFTNVPVEETI